MINRLVSQNLRANRKNNWIFIVASAVIYALIFVFYSLIDNEYVRTRNEHLVSFITFGAVVSSVIALIFTLYVQRFLFKRRARELSLYQVLGLEKKHIIEMLGKESLCLFLVTATLTTLTGYVIGVISFLSLTRFLHMTLESLTHFKFDPKALLITLGVLMLGCIGNLFLNIVHVARKSPAELMSYDKKAEKEPQVNVLLFILGLLTLGGGYYLALTIKNPLEAIVTLFVAIVLVVIGTYCLFIAGSIFVLKMLRANSHIYYKKENFLSLSNLMYRMKSGSISLATIAILCSAVILTITGSYSLGIGLKDANLESDYELTYYFPDYSKEEIPTKDMIEEKEQSITQTLDADISYRPFITASRLIKIDQDGVIDYDLQQEKISAEHVNYLTVTTKDYYERAFDVKLPDLQAGEVYYYASRPEIRHLQSIRIGGKTYMTRPIKDKSAKNMALEKIFLVFDTYDPMGEIIAKNANNEGFGNALRYDLFIDEKAGQHLSETLQAFAASHEMEYVSQKELAQFLEIFSGGLLFIGILLSIIFTVITSFVLYYKQVNEAEEDRRRYLILQKLGVSEKMATHTIQKQMRSVFLSPILVAVVHNLFASHMLSVMLRIFLVRSHMVYLEHLAVVSAVFVVVYLVIYLVAQKAYKMIVWPNYA
ncbi:ABC transporter permease [Allofustis seminis]|uniref:ABC transporter permease n=1 Tax=Allofustis seminis TaxID=166939 RepID=UPI000366EEB7|nr:FtsX-like permease family protein [Allofustis seminis]